MDRTMGKGENRLATFKPSGPGQEAKLRLIIQACLRLRRLGYSILEDADVSSSPTRNLGTHRRINHSRGGETATRPLPSSSLPTSKLGNDGIVVAQPSRSISMGMVPDAGKCFPLSRQIPRDSLQELSYISRSPSKGLPLVPRVDHGHHPHEQSARDKFSPVRDQKKTGAIVVKGMKRKRVTLGECSEASEQAQKAGKVAWRAGKRVLFADGEGKVWHALPEENMVSGERGREGEHAQEWEALSRRLSEAREMIDRASSSTRRRVIEFFRP